MNVIAYCRVSTANQKKEGTIKQQVDAVEKYCREKKYQLIRTFSDDGVSGSLKDRPALADLFAYLGDNEGIEAIVILKLDRLARDLVIQENLIREFQERNVKLISTQEPDLDSTDPTRVLVRQILGVISEYEKAMIVLRLDRGRMWKARRGGYAGGGIPLGYATKKGELKLNGETDVVKTIFRLKRNHHYPIRKIARTLNEEEIPTKKGGKWYASTISYILKNPVYKGKYSYSSIKNDRDDLALV